MKKVIYCFSGTGNSLQAARIIADELKDTGIVNVRKDPSVYSAEDAKVIGFVCPVYEWDIPGRMKAFISELIAFFSLLFKELINDRSEFLRPRHIHVPCSMAVYYSAKGLIFEKIP